MGWGGTDNLDLKTVGGFSGPAVEVRPTRILFVTSDQVARAYCHLLGEHETLRFCDVSIAHDPSAEELAARIPRTRLVVIGTCRASVDNGSAAQKREKLACLLARQNGIRIAILAAENHEAVQDHLAEARGTQPLVIVPVHGMSFGEGFMDSFPMRTQFVERGESPEHLNQIALELLKRSA